MMLSTFGTAVNSSEATYLKSDDSKYYRLTDTYLESNHNIRTKKFTYKYAILFDELSMLNQEGKLF